MSLALFSVLMSCKQRVLSDESGGCRCANEHTAVQLPPGCLQRPSQPHLAGKAGTTVLCLLQRCHIVSATPSACSFCKHCSWPCGTCGVWLLSGSAMQVCCWMCRQSTTFLSLHALCTEYSTEYSIRLRLDPLGYTHHICIFSGLYQSSSFCLEWYSVQVTSLL